MKIEHLDFITFCVGSLADALHWSASRVMVHCVQQDC